MAAGLLWARMLGFALLNFLPAVASSWWLAVLPAVLAGHFGVADAALVSYYAGAVFTAGYYGALAGALVWPAAVRVLEKRACLLLSVAAMGVAVAAGGWGHGVGWWIFCRVMQGLAYNVHTVGKDFVFDSFSADRRQFVLTLDSVFGALGILAGPMLGLGLFRAFGASFAFASAAVAAAFLAGGVAFLLLFCVYGHKSPCPALEEEEERARLSAAPEEWGSLAAMIAATACPRVRTAMLLFACSVACCTADVILSTLYLLAPWEDGGLGASPLALSLASTLAFVPCVGTLLWVSRAVPTRLSARRAITALSATFAAAVCLLPLLRPAAPRAPQSVLIAAALALQAVKSCTNGHVFAPLLHYMLNARLARGLRTPVNALNYVVSVAAAIGLTNLAVPLYSGGLRPGRAPGRLLAFWLVAAVQLLPLAQLRRAGAPAAQL